VTLVLLDAAGRPIGALPPYEVTTPYWQDMGPVVAGARDRYGVEVAVLRLLSAGRPEPHGGAVTYLAQTGAAPPAGLTAPVEVDLSPDPHRAPYAEPGGPAASLRWAGEALRALGRGPILGAAQERTWNLSAIWSLRTGDGPVWLKQVPRFFAHEPAVLRWIAGIGYGHLVPRVLAADAGRILLDHVDGDDLYGAGLDVRIAIVADLHPVQRVASGRVEELLRLGLPDRRPAPLVEALRHLVARHGAGDPRLDALVAGLDERMARVAACRLPETLLHGDLHPGNVRGHIGGLPPDGHRRVVIDWGDSCVTHPAFDILRMTEGLADGDARAVIDAWAAPWRAGGGDPEVAVELLRPVAALRNAAAYADFLDHIEPAEHPYHAADVGLWLAKAADLADPPV
jgi:hypothetical protein